MIYNETKQLFKELNIDLKEEQHNKFSSYQKLLLEWNENINLTTITEDNDVWIKHFLDSCTINKYINENSTIIDVGTGAGFPTLPVRIIREDIKLTLLDSLNKRISFLKEVCKELNLNNIDYIHGRAEDVANDLKYREKYDVVTARAVANLSTLSEYCIPFIKIGGIFVCMKAGNVKKEISEAKTAISKLGGIIEKTESFKIPNTDIERTIIIIKKVSSTPKIYPRKAGIPSAKPL